MAKPDNTLKRKEREEKEDAEDGLKFVIDGAKLKCDLCIVPEGDLKVNYDTPSTQDKRTATIVEKDKKSVIFKGNCKKSPQSASPCASVMKLADWKDVGTVYFQDEFPLLLKSTIKCEYGGIPVEITDSAQRNVIEKIDTTGAPVPPMKELLQDKIPEYVVLFKRLPSYKGEFGWDYMRDDYLTGTCNGGLEDLKMVYNPIEIQTKNKTTSAAYGTYYTPWLSMFVNHNAVVGTDIELIVDAPIDFISDSVDFSTEEMTFIPSIPNLRVVPDKMPISDAINGGRIKIFCDTVLDADAIIDIKSSKGDVVGKLNVLKNKDVEKLTINVYVIKAFLIDDPTFDKSIIDAKIASLGGLQVIEDYLNKQSLNQALIQVKLIYDARYDWENKKSTLIMANDGKDTQTGLLSDSFAQYKGMISNTTSMLMDSGKYMEYINDKFKLKFNDLAAKKGMFLYLTPFNSPSAGGASYTTPLDSKRIILFKTNLEDLSTYAHEIGHTLGLEHTFLGKDSRCNLITVQTEINAATTKKRNAIEEKRTFFEVNPNNIAYFRQFPDKKAQYAKPYDKNIKYYTDELKVLNNNKIRFVRAKTENIMDYSSDQDCSTPPSILYRNTNKALTFNKYQWKIMEEEAKNIYH